MQINPFGFPLGAGAQSASAFAGTGLGFIDALGVAIEGAAPQPLTGLVASPTPPANLSARLAQALAAAQQLDPQAAPAPATLPGLQQPTSLSQLMATAAKLPTAEVAVPAAGDTITAAPLEAPAAPLTETPAAPAQSEAAKPDAQPQPSVLPAEPEAQPDPALAAEAPAVVTPVETAPTPRRAPRAAAAVADADPAQPAAANTAIPAELLAAAGMTAQPAMQAQTAAQPQAAPREAMQAANGSAAPVARKSGAHALAGDAAQPAASAGTPATADFANAVAARGESAGGDANADGQGQPELRTAVAGRADVPAPAFQPAPATAAAAPAGAPAAEPVIEARTGHLGHSLGVEIARKVELGEETLRIRLNPIELGRIEVTLAFDDKGSLQATVRTESAQAMDLLRQDAPDLARTLDQAGVRTDAQSFRFEQRSGDGGGQQAQQQHAQNRGQFASSDDDAGAAEPIYRPVRSDGQVDLLA